MMTQVHSQAMTRWRQSAKAILTHTFSFSSSAVTLFPRLLADQQLGIFFPEPIQMCWILKKRKTAYRQLKRKRWSRTKKKLSDRWRKLVDRECGCDKCVINWLFHVRKTSEVRLPSTGAERKWSSWRNRANVGWRGEAWWMKEERGRLDNGGRREQ